MQTPFTYFNLRSRYKRKEAAYNNEKDKPTVQSAEPQDTDRRTRQIETGQNDRQNDKKTAEKQEGKMIGKI